MKLRSQISKSFTACNLIEQLQLGCSIISTKPAISRKWSPLVKRNWRAGGTFFLSVLRADHSVSLVHVLDASGASHLHCYPDGTRDGWTTRIAATPQWCIAWAIANGCSAYSFKLLSMHPQLGRLPTLHNKKRLVACLF